MNKKIIFFAFVLIVATSSGFSANKIFYASGPSTGKKIALTFDDGPGPQTPEFLALLDKYHVKATFFMLGELVQFRGTVAHDVLAHGHEAASHTFFHTNYHAKLKQLVSKNKETAQNHPLATKEAKKMLLDDMTRTRAVIEKAVGSKIFLCRMPHGVDGPWIHEVAQEAGFTLVNWTFGADWTKASADELIPSYIKAIKPGAILLLHDGGSKREKTLRITEAIIKAAQEKGYDIVPVGNLLNLTR